MNGRRTHGQKEILYFLSFFYFYWGRRRSSSSSGDASKFWLCHFDEQISRSIETKFTAMLILLSGATNVIRPTLLFIEKKMILNREKDWASFFRVLRLKRRSNERNFYWNHSLFCRAIAQFFWFLYVNRFHIQMLLHQKFHKWHFFSHTCSVFFYRSEKKSVADWENVKRNFIWCCSHATFILEQNMRFWI